MEFNDELLQDVLTDLETLSSNQELIIDNKLPFLYEGMTYEVRMPTQRDLVKAESVRNQKFVELIKQPNTLRTKDLIKVLKDNQNIDILEMEKQIKELETQERDLYLSLAQVKDGSEKTIQSFKDKIVEVKNKRYEICLEKVSLLAVSIENQCRDEYYRYLTSVCTFKLVLRDEANNEEWKHVWNSFAEYDNEVNKIALVALGQLTRMLIQV